MNTKVRKYLIDLANKRKTCSYSDVNDACNLGLQWTGDHDSGEIGRILGEIAEYEFRQGRPLISAIVFKKGTTEQGEGFYRICEYLNIGTTKKLKANLFAELEVGKCFDFWSDPGNYRQFCD